nr:MAG TPA: hypothetical protein [Caudoviricetes sp.]
MVLFADSDVKENAEPHAENIEIEVAPLNSRSSAALQVTNLKSVNCTGLSEQIPAGGACSDIGAVGEVWRTDHLEVFIGNDVQSRSDDIVSTAGHYKGCAASKLDCQVLECCRDHKITGFHRDRLTVRIDLIQVKLDGFLEAVCGKSRGRAGEQVFVCGGEQGFTIALSGVCQKATEKQLVHQTCSAVTHCHRNFEERAQIVVDNHFSGQAELFGEGVDLVLCGFFDESAFLDLTVCGHREKVSHVGQAETVCFLKVVQVTGGTEFGGYNRLGFIRLEQFLISNIAQNTRQRNSAESRLDRLLSKRRGTSIPSRRRHSPIRARMLMSRSSQAVSTAFSP